MFGVSSEIRGKFSVIYFLHSVPSCATSLACDLLLVNTVLVSLLIGPFGALPRRLGILLRGILPSCLDVLSCKVLLDCSHCDVASYISEELIGLWLLCSLALLLLALAVRRNVIATDFWFASLSMLMWIPRILLRLILIKVLLLVLNSLILILLLLLLLLLLPLLVLSRLVIIPSTLLGLVSPWILLGLPGLLAKFGLFLLVLSFTCSIGQARRSTSHGAAGLTCAAHHEIWVAESLLFGCLICGTILLHLIVRMILCIVALSIVICILLLLLLIVVILWLIIVILLLLLVIIIVVLLVIVVVTTAIVLLLVLIIALLLIAAVLVLLLLAFFRCTAFHVVLVGPAFLLHKLLLSLICLFGCGATSQIVLRAEVVAVVVVLECRLGTLIGLWRLRFIAAATVEIFQTEFFLLLLLLLWLLLLVIIVIILLLLLLLLLVIASFVIIPILLLIVVVIVVCHF